MQEDRAGPPDAGGNDPAPRGVELSRGGLSPREVSMIYLAGAGIMCGMGAIAFLLKKRSEKGNRTISIR